MFRLCSRAAFGLALLVGLAGSAVAQTASPPGDQQILQKGRHLVAADGCAACHTAAGGAPFAGGIVGAWNAPALRNDPHDGLAVWSAGDIALYLKTGHNPYADASGPMAGVITHVTSKLTEADDRAIGVYLKSLPAMGVSPSPIPATDPRMVAGAHIYADECAACHTGEGTGAANLFPALRASPVVQARDPVTLVQIVLHGGQSVGTTTATAGAMPAFGSLLSNQEVADVLTYIRNSWGNAAPAVAAGNIHR
jgi:mono/diheme cytochrome c family protein